MDTTCNDGKRKASPPTVAATAAAAAAVPPGDGDEASILIGTACATTLNSTDATLDIDASAANTSNNDRYTDDNNMGNDDDNNNSSDYNSKNNDDDRIPPVSKFKVFDKVIARDKDGLMYDAVIRRCLYGSAEPQQIPIGLFSNAEAEVILRKRQEQDSKQQQQLATTANGDATTTSATDSEPPAWHYFVHYNKWAVNWDRWVSQDDVYEPTDKIQAYAARIQKEHKDLSNQLASSKPGKKKRQTIDGHAFLGQWRLRLERIDAEMDMYNPLISPFSTTAAAIKKSKQQDMEGQEENEEEHDGDDNKKSKKGKQRGQQSQSAANTTGANIGSWSEATLAAEMKNRIEHNLTNMRQPAVAKKLVLPFALHKILVDQWEIISQCNMLPSLPAPVTVRQILNRYLASKQQQQQQQPAVQQLDDTAKATTTENGNVDGSPAKSSTVDNNSNMGISPSLASTKSPPTTEPNSCETKGANEGAVGTSLPEHGKDMSSETKQEATLEQEKKQDKGGEKDPLKDNPESSNDDVPQEFIEMAEGIASFFDQALPTRLLYRQEIPQLRVLDAILPEECLDKPLSEIYGGEHLLRLFIRLPEALVDGFAAAAARSKSKNDIDDFQDPSPRIFALLSDFARFLHKHQSTLFCQSHRKWTAIELKEQQKMAALQQRRKRAAQLQQQPPTPSYIASTSTSKNDDGNEGKVEADSSKRSKSPPSSQRGRKRPKKSPTN